MGYSDKLLAEALELEDYLLIEDVEIRSAVFEELRIVFEVEVTVDTTRRGGPDMREYPRKQILHGFVAQNLTASIQVPFTGASA